MPEPDSALRMLTVAEVVQQTGLTEYAVRLAIRNGELKHRRLGRGLYIPARALESFVAGEEYEDAAAQA